MGRCKTNNSRQCVGENLPKDMDNGEWDEERARHYDLAEAIANGCSEKPDESKPMITLLCKHCVHGRLVDQKHRNGTARISKIQVVCNKCRWSGYRLE